MGPQGSHAHPSGWQSFGSPQTLQGNQSLNRWTLKPHLMSPTSSSLLTRYSGHLLPLPYSCLLAQQCPLGGFSFPKTLCLFLTPLFRASLPELSAMSPPAISPSRHLLVIPGKYPCTIKTSSFPPTHPLPCSDYPRFPSASPPCSFRQDVPHVLLREQLEGAIDSGQWSGGLPACNEP